MRTGSPRCCGLDISLQPRFPCTTSPTTYGSRSWEKSTTSRPSAKSTKVAKNGAKTCHSVPSHTLGDVRSTSCLKIAREKTYRTSSGKRKNKNNTFYNKFLVGKNVSVCFSVCFSCKQEKNASERSIVLRMKETKANRPSYKRNEGRSSFI